MLPSTGYYGPRVNIVNSKAMMRVDTGRGTLYFVVGFRSRPAMSCAEVHHLQAFRPLQRPATPHRVLHGDCILGPTRVLVWDPCPFGFPEMVTVAHIKCRVGPTSPYDAAEIYNNPTAR